MEISKTPMCTSGLAVSPYTRKGLASPVGAANFREITLRKHPSPVLTTLLMMTTASMAERPHTTQLQDIATCYSTLRLPSAV